MKKTILIIFAILTALASYSQGTIQVTEAQAKQAIKNAIRVETQQIELAQHAAIIVDYKGLLTQYMEQINKKDLQIGLLRENVGSLETQLEAEQEKKQKNTWFRDILIVIGVFSAGFVAGSL